MPTPKSKSKTLGAPTIAASPFAQVDAMFGDYNRPADYHYPFDYLVAVAGRIDSPGPMDPMWEYILDAGRTKLKDVLAERPIGGGPHYFIFPDRWLVPAQAQAFFHHLLQNPDASKFDRVYVVTHQPYLVGDCRKEQVRVVRKKPEGS